MKSERNILSEYTIKVGPKVYIFRQIPLERSPIGKWSLSYSKVREMMLAVAATILADKELQLSFAELEHLADTAEMSMAQIAELLKISRSTITKWKRSSHGLIPFAESYCLKDKIPKLLFNFEERKDDASCRADFWFTKGNLPRPDAA